MLHMLTRVRRYSRHSLIPLLAIPLLVGCDGSDPTSPVSERAVVATSADATLKSAETHEFGNFALYLPANAPKPRAVLVALGGPDTRAFVTQKATGAPFPHVEAGLQLLGAQFRELAADHKIALLGTSLSAMQNSAANDEVLLEALREAAELSGRPELANLPVLVYGISGGAPQASGFVARNPERIVGLFLKVPEHVETISGGAGLGVPTFMILAEFDIFIDNVELTQSFAANRGAGAYWGMAIEPGAPHFSIPTEHRQLTVDWIAAVLGMRLRGASGQPLRSFDENSGWLGDLSTGAFGPAASYSGDRTATSWLPSRDLALSWKAFAGFGG